MESQRNAEADAEASTARSDRSVRSGEPNPAHRRAGFAAWQWASRHWAAAVRWLDPDGWIRPGYARHWAAAWQWLDPDGWLRPGYARHLTRAVASGRLPVRGAWLSWCNNPRQDRYSRRRADVLRRVGRMDGTAAATSIAGGRLATRRRPGSPAAGGRVHPWRIVRRVRVARWLASAVAAGQIRASSLPDAAVVASATSDGIDPIPRIHGRDRHPVPIDGQPVIEER